MWSKTETRVSIASLILSLIQTIIAIAGFYYVYKYRHHLKRKITTHNNENNIPK